MKGDYLNQKYTGKCVICGDEFKSSWSWTKTCPLHRREWKLKIRRENFKKWYYKQVNRYFQGCCRNINPNYHGSIFSCFFPCCSATINSSSCDIPFVDMYLAERIGNPIVF